MNFILKIVEGPNKGAEVALVPGVAVTLGKGDDCDIVLADSTMPDVPLKIEAGEDSVTVGGDSLEPLHVMTAGSTSFAVGPADAPWGALVWPKAEEAGGAGAEEAAPEPAPAGEAAGEAAPEAREEAPKAETPEPGGRRRGGCLGCLAALVFAVAAAVFLVWFFRDDPRVAGVRSRVMGLAGRGEEQPAEPGDPPAEAGGLEALAGRYNLSFSADGGVPKLAGNFKTRAERLKATAEAYAAQPGVELDLSDDESFRAAAEDAVFTLTEGALRVLSATNRVMALGGVSRSPAALTKCLKALAADLPKLKDADVSAVKFSALASAPGESGEDEETPAPVAAKRGGRASAPAKPSLPVCGILTTPYPCLVMQNGMRVMEGAAIGENVILKIEADSVVVTNSTGRFEWRP